MARAFAIEGARPADTYLRSADFTLTWSPVEGVSSYLVRVHAAGDTTARTVTGTSLSAASLKLEAGRRYEWTVSAAGTPMPMSSPSAWLQIATATQLSGLHAAEAALDSVLAPAATPPALRAALYADLGFADDARQLLQTVTPPATTR